MKNFIIRAITAIVFVVVLVGCIEYSAESMAALFAFITCLSVREFCHIINKQEGVQVNVFITSLASTLLFGAFFLYCGNYCDATIFLPFLASMIYLLVAELYLKHPNPIVNWAYIMMAQIYVALPFSLLNVLGYTSDPAHPLVLNYQWILPLSIFFFLWANDTGAYLTGWGLSRYIPYKLFPRISPKKSWIGSIGGGLLTLGVAALIYTWEASEGQTTLTLLQWMGLGLTVVFFGTWGDLVESLLKRTLGIKDSGNILPGHGGMLDRFDSSLLAIPAAVIYLHLLQMG
ncbi:MAG: phosphatidate cytidylyltransferase [Bacteroidaceae bacterium]|nr:phosphatidate cytidylyltransferase [Bacteroidaceae bacterium]